jgi:hypothetical protein
LKLISDDIRTISMRSHISVFLPAVGFFGRLPALDLRSGVLSQQKLSHETEALADAEVGGPDAYKVAVLLLVGAAILSLF